MKKVVGFLLAFLIFVTPVTTLVKADVVIGDNDSSVMNENAIILGRKLAMLESLSDLALSGVTEFTISNTEDLDSYLDSLWSEVNDAIDYLDTGEWVGDIQESVASKYFTNLVKYRDIVNNRGEFLGFDLQNPTTSLLKTYFANDTYGRKYTSTNLYNTLDTLRAISGLSRGSNNNLPEDYSFLQNINSLYIKDLDSNNIYSWFSPSNYFYGGTARDISQGNTTSYSYMAYDLTSNHLSTTNNTYINNLNPCTPITINITGNDTNGYDVQYQNLNFIRCDNWYTPRLGNDGFWSMSLTYKSSIGGYNITGTYQRPDFAGSTYILISHFDSLSSCLNRLYAQFCNVTINVNGVTWINAINQINSNPTIDIDGFLKIFGDDNPQPYELQPNTQIDYDQLYQVIYNAIRDNLPISQGDINYYDSHDTIYSPTIINNYGEEEGDESDLIDTILDYAVIPKFDTAIAQPMRNALTNGVVIMNNSITNVIPNEIMLILGACFFLLLFAVVINRMIK